MNKKYNYVENERYNHMKYEEQRLEDLKESFRFIWII
jgi:hypothetical protein